MYVWCLRDPFVGIRYIIRVEEIVIVGGGEGRGGEERSGGGVEGEWRGERIGVEGEKIASKMLRV